MAASAQAHPFEAQPVITLAADDPAQTAFNTGMKRYQEGTAVALRDAISHWDAALRLWQHQQNRSQEITALNWLGLAYSDLGEYDQALAQYQKLLPLTQAVQDRHTQASTLMSMAKVYNKQGQYQQALDSLNQALPLWQTVKYKTGEAATLNNLGLLYLDLGELDQALENYNRSLELARTLGNPNNEAATLNNRGQILSERGDLEAALQDYNQALSLWNQTQNNRGQAATLNNIGFVYANSGKFEQALELYQQALPIWQGIGNAEGQSLGDRTGEASTLNNICVVKTRQGQLAPALELCQQALEIRQALGDRPKAALSLLRIAQIQRQQGELDTALTTIESALTIIESLRSNLASQELRTSFFATKQEYYEFYIDLLMELNRQRPGQGYDGQALQASERAKARSLLEILAEAQGEVTAGIDPKLLQQQRELQYQLNATEERRIRLLSGDHNEAQKAQLEAEVETLLNQFDQLQAQIRATSPRYSSLTQPQPLGLPEIQQQILEDDTVLLEYALGETRSYLWVVTPTTLDSYELPGRDKIESAVRKFRNAFLLPTQRIQRKLTEESGIALAKMVLPEPQKLANKRLLVVADGAMQYIPFAALPTQQLTPDQPLAPLIVNHEIVTLPSASTLGVLRQEVKGRSLAPGALAVMADPVFSYKDERLKNIASEDLQILPPELERSARESGVLFDRLPFTQQEAEQILALVPPTESARGFGFEARREFVIGNELDQYRLIHFATHGLLNSENPELSGLVFSLVDESGKSLNGFLRLYEIFNLNLSAELAVLSACETGLGEDVKGEGLVGLTRGFMYAGTPRVVVSLWAVDDQATSQLMIKFYQKMLQQGLAPSAALRLAQIEMWKQQAWASPYFWAAFTLQGEWRNYVN
ncbi:MAG: CHAT domain-containing protein [Oscillatoriales cyanobacterium RM1_1_9]|nr:CHAT domain-containing protein [Oscillatoriales cyanobacterium SM2_3_0]NJO45737.1 CHAT domain-containing protein [Oscillatoriales cyanobacterium RM2_1_1]NJO71035.1 CHAT domain-containing protein [Oscillatoriales cyanobacterium RM1_1_9]